MTTYFYVVLFLLKEEKQTSVKDNNNNRQEFFTAKCYLTLALQDLYKHLSRLPSTYWPSKLRNSEKDSFLKTHMTVMLGPGEGVT